MIERGERRSDSLAALMSDGSVALTRTDLESRSIRLSHLLRGLGLHEGDRVAILLENALDWFSTLWGVRRAGLLAVPVNWHLKADEVRYVLDNSDARVLITSDAMVALAAEAASGIAAIAARLTTGPARAGFAALDDALAGRPEATPPDEPDGGVMLYSSGTSGRPKGILRRRGPAPFRTPTPVEALLIQTYGLNGDTVYLCPAPLYHAAPIGWTSAVMLAGGTVVLMPRFDPEQVLAAIARWRVTHAQFVPTHFIRMLRLPEETRRAYDLSSLKAVVHAAAPCPPDVKRAIIAWFGPIVLEYYSGSEGCGLTTIDSAEWMAHPGSVGRSRRGPIHITDPDTGEELPSGLEGLVSFELREPFEYHKDPQKTAAAIDQRGWGGFGDVGRLDEEGYLYLSDRLSHLIISGGVNIYPQEIENLLAGHAAVSDVAVVGVPDAEFGEAVKAVVEPAPGVIADAALAAELIAFCRAHLANFKCPKTVDFTAALPRHPNGKLLKRELMSRYAAAPQAN